MICKQRNALMPSEFSSSSITSMLLFIITDLTIVELRSDKNADFLFDERYTRNYGWQKNLKLKTPTVTTIQRIG